ncbi:hypothetical protein [Virgisporangium aurantiacum]|nr:hypothetical protein [Virgisporangium aurantiacum]
MIDESEWATRRRLAELPDTTVHVSHFLEHDGHTNHLSTVNLRAVKNGDELVLDFSGQPPVDVGDAGQVVVDGAVGDQVGQAVHEVDGRDGQFASQRTSRPSLQRAAAAWMTGTATPTATSPTASVTPAAGSIAPTRTTEPAPTRTVTVYGSSTRISASRTASTSVTGRTPRLIPNARTATIATIRCSTGGCSAAREMSNAAVAISPTPARWLRHPPQWTVRAGYCRRPRGRQQ